MERQSVKDLTSERHVYLCSLLRELRVNSGYTLEQVAKEIKLSRNSISKIERQGYFRIQHLYLLADFYEIPINELFADFN